MYGKHNFYMSTVTQLTCTIIAHINVMINWSTEIMLYIRSNIQSEWTNVYIEHVWNLFTFCECPSINMYMKDLIMNFFLL